MEEQKEKMHFLPDETPQAPVNWNRPIFKWSSADLLVLAERLEKQGLFAAIDIQTSYDDDGNAHNLGNLNDVVADCVRFVGETRAHSDRLFEHLKTQNPAPEDQDNRD